MMQKSSLSNFCLTNVRNLKVFLEVHARDIDFLKSEQSYPLTSTDAEAAAVRLLLPLHRKRYILFDFINLTQVHNFTVSVQDIFYLTLTFGIYRKFYRNFAITNEIMKRFTLSY